MSWVQEALMNRLKPPTMAVFAGALQQRLRALSGSQQSVETAALYVLHHAASGPEIARVWAAELPAGAARARHTGRPA